jgi:hypothetical protein
MDICEICHEDIENEKTEMPCCKNFFHTNCILQIFRNQLLHSSKLDCHCGHNIFSYTSSYYQDSMSQQQEQILETPEFKEDIEILKKKIKEVSSKSSSFNKYFNEKYANYKEIIAPHIETIKILKKDFIHNISQTQEYKDITNKSSSMIRMINKIINKHGIHRSNLFRYPGIRIYAGYRYMFRGRYVLLRKTRIRI